MSTPDRGSRPIAEPAILSGAPPAPRSPGGTPPGSPRRPAVLAVDDDPQVLRAIRRDLCQAYAQRYRVLASGSGSEALSVLETLRTRSEDVALLITDQRMPEMTGVEFLGESLARFPRARRVLLTAYADTEAAIAGINTARLSHYILKPWDPPDQRLYPVLDALLEEWKAAS